jgi:hypothetical protein
MNVVLPELDGRLLTRAVSFKAEPVVDPELQYAPAVHEPVADRVDFVARLAAAWAGLGRKPRHERRLALVLSDYPHRGGRRGYAVGLDTPASVCEILTLLACEGYDTGATRLDLSPLLSSLTSSRRRPGSTTPGQRDAEACVDPDLRRDDVRGTEVPDVCLDDIRACIGPGLAPSASPPRSRLRATPRGRLVLNTLVAELSKAFEPAPLEPVAAHADLG